MGLRVLQRLASALAAPGRHCKNLYRSTLGRLRRRRRLCLCITSPLRGSAVKLAKPRWKNGTPDGWHGFCPCCKRPLEMRLSHSWSSTSSVETARGRYAYVINLWGTSNEYVLGALVLGHSIKKTRSTHARVCLYAEDVPEAFVSLLSKIWDCRPVQHVHVAARELGNSDPQHRFSKVFTKLRAMELIEFEKILVLDIDLLITSNIDELFELQAPAAMRRGMNDWNPLKTGDWIDGSAFFMGKDKSRWSWSQGTGINAGVMLWQPDREVFQEMLSELSEPNHPEHCAGNGPEQDYLSRFWADAPWTHLDVAYNYQVHQLFMSIHPDKVASAERVSLLQTLDRIKVIHYSGDDSAKPWRRILDETLKEYWPDRGRDSDFVKLFAEEFQGYWLWVKRDREWLESSKTMSSRSWELVDFHVADDGSLYRQADGSSVCVDLPQETEKAVMEFLRQALQAWFDTFEEMQAEMKLDLSLLIPPQISMKSREELETPLALFQWQREQDGWWTEKLPSSTMKVTVTCGGSESGRFVKFLEGGITTYEKNDVGLTGIFIKVAGGKHGCHFALPLTSESQEALESWIASAHAGSPILLALLGDEPAAALPILQTLGVPELQIRILAPGLCTKALSKLPWSCETYLAHLYGALLGFKQVFANRQIAWILFETKRTG